MKMIKTVTSVLALVAVSTSMAQAKTPKVNEKDAAQEQQIQVELPTVNYDAKTEVAYSCGTNGSDKVRVMYALDSKTNEAVLAQVLYQNILSPVLLRVGDEDMNRFSSNGITWTADKANAKKIDKVDGNMLSQSDVQEIDGQKVPVEQIVTKYCKLDKAETKKLAVANKKAEQEALAEAAKEAAVKNK